MTRSASDSVPLPRGRTLDLAAPAVMGILNCTPDSFSDGGAYARVDDAVARGLAMLEEGAAVIDIGGESTRPGAAPVEAGEECRRVLPVVEGLRARTDAPLSVDTSKPEVARAALEAGADIINDVRALRVPGMTETCAAGGAAVVLMHMRGDPGTMQDAPRYDDVVAEVGAFLLARAAAAEAGGVARAAILLDPGFGFGKTFSHNAALLRGLETLAASGYPVLAGLSRKSMIRTALGLAEGERLEASLALAVLAAERGASVLRVHDVRATVRALGMAASVLAGAEGAA